MQRRLLAGDAVGGAADHDRQLDLMVGARIRMADDDLVVRPGQRRRRLQEQADALDLRHLVLVMDLGVGARFVEMLLVVHRRGDDLAGIGDGREQRHIGELVGFCAGQQLGDAHAQLRQARDQQINRGQGVTLARQQLQSFGDIANGVAFDHAEPVIVEAAELHGGAFPSSAQAGGGRV